jgi:sarcosine oxidase, subunit delta
MACACLVHAPCTAFAGPGMLLLTCPACGVAAEETEFAPGGEAHLSRVAEGPDDALAAYLFERRNPRGVHFERWRHAYGCGKWFHVARCTATLEIFGSYSAQASEAPAEIMAAIRARRPGWEPGA